MSVLLLYSVHNLRQQKKTPPHRSSPGMDTPMFFYPFSNVHSNDRVCTGNNVLPRYRKISALKNFPRYLLGLPDNDDMYDREHNRLKLSHGELLEHLKDKDPAYY